MSRTIFVGDLHGCATEFEELLGRLEFDADSDRLLLVGDAFTRGPEPLAVWRSIERIGAEMVLGNHDAKLLDRLRRRRSGRPDRSMKSSRRMALDALMPVVDELVDWLADCPLYIEGRMPDGLPWVLVHAGIHPEQGLEGTTRQEFLKIRAWPPTLGILGPRWYEFYDGERLVIFGHDALRGLVFRRRSDDRPQLIGLDTGCVYGGRLTGYILEEDRLVQVKSRQG